MLGKITIFRDIKEISVPHYLSIETILNRIKDGNSEEKVTAIRTEKNKEKRDAIKKKLPSICFSGQFSKREDTAIMEHSGIICLDFDGFKNMKRQNAVRKGMTLDPIVLSVFTSPSGVGLKVLVKVPPVIENHKRYFKALEKYWAMEEFDKSCVNISRVCYESHDPDIYINYESEVYEELAEEEFVEVERSEITATIAIDDENKIVENLFIWFEKNYEMVSGQRSDNLYKLAAAFNQYGVAKLSAAFICVNKYQQKGFNAEEIRGVVDSAYRKTGDFNSKAFEDADKMHSLQRKIKRGESKSDIESQIIDEYDIDKKEAKAIVERINEKAQEDLQVFWKKSDKGVVSIQHDRFTEFLQDNGFYKFYPEGSKNFIFVRKVSNRVKNTTEQTIKDFVLGYIRKRVQDRAVWNFFADKVRFFKEDFLSMLEAIEIQFMVDTRDDSYLFFRNMAIRVDKKNVEQIEYEKLPGWIWEDQMIDRDFKDCDGTMCEFRKFIHNISGDEPKRIESVESTIGFLLHGYKPSSYCPAVILNDEIISENPEGGTGKGIFTTAISQLRKTVKIDGKMFRFDKSFPYQTVQQDTQIIAFDDVQKNWKFENTFPLITEGMTLEKKNKDAIFIDFESSPKIIVTTNYAIRGSGNSFDRRKWELEFKQFYTKSHTPRDEFGHDLFTDWNDSEWCIYDNYMVGCLQMYLDRGFVKSPFKNLKARQFIAATNHDFFEFMSDKSHGFGKAGIKHLANSIFNSFLEDYPDYGPNRRNTLARKFFIQWLMAYGEYAHGGESERDRGSNGIWVRFNEKKKSKNQINMGL